MPGRLVSVALYTSMAVATLAGCSTSTMPKEDDTTKDLNHIQRAYGIMVAGHNRPPRDMAEIRKILEELHSGDLNPAPDEVLTSSRDGQPYVIIMGADLGGTGPGSDILAYEKTGVEGKRYVLLMSREIREMSDAEFSRATFAKGHKPGANESVSK